jgi:hypothetical protein
MKMKRHTTLWETTANWCTFLLTEMANLHQSFKQHVHKIIQFEIIKNFPQTTRISGQIGLSGNSNCCCVPYGKFRLIILHESWQTKQLLYVITTNTMLTKTLKHLIRPLFWSKSITAINGPMILQWKQKKTKNFTIRCDLDASLIMSALEKPHKRPVSQSSDWNSPLANS